MSINIIAKGKPGAEYLLTDIIATRMTETQFKQAQALNRDLLGAYRFIPQAETDFTWWHRISKKLTNKAIRSAYFECDFYGNVTEV